jgi:hypothetical protein
MSLKPFDIQDAQDLVKDAVSRSEKRHKQWRLMEGLYRTGTLAQAEQSATGRLQDFFPTLNDEVANLILPHINIIQESVVARDPQLLCEPLAGGEQAEVNAKTSESVLKYFWKRARATEALRDATLDSVRLGTGFLKVAWSHLETEVELSEEEQNARASEQFREELESSVADGILPDADIALKPRSVPTSEVMVIRDEPFVAYVSPFDVFVPVEARRLEEARWVAQRVTLPVDEILANPEFDVDEDSIIRDGTVEGGTDVYESEWRRQAPDSEGTFRSTLASDTATYWEFYDMRTRRLMIFQVNGGDVWYDEELSWSHRYSPFVHVRNYSATGNDFWGFGDIENVVALQEMFNEFLFEQMDNARRSGQKYFVRADQVSDELRAGLESDESDVVIPVHLPTGESLRDVLIPVARQALAGDVYAAKDELERKMREVLGINDFQAGGVGADRMSATAAAVVDGVATLRAQSKIASVEAAASQVGNLILLLCQEYLDEPTAIRVSNVSGASWIDVSKDDLFGEFLVSVEGGSTRALNPATREQQGLRTLVEVVPALQALGYDPEPALRMALRDLGYDPNIILVRAEQPAEAGVPPQGGGAPSAMSSGEMIEAQGGPSMPAEMQARGDIAL